VLLAVLASPEEWGNWSFFSVAVSEISLYFFDCGSCSQEGRFIYHLSPWFSSDIDNSNHLGICVNVVCLLDVLPSSFHFQVLLEYL
jgi:hypothetical protein